MGINSVSRGVERLMVNLFEGGDKEAGPSGELRVVTLLDRGVQEANSLNSRPAVQAELYLTLGSIYQKLGKLDQADSLLQSALDRRKSVFGPDHQEVAGSLLAIGLLRIDQARLPDAERAIREALSMTRRHLPPSDPAVAKATAVLGRALQERGQYDQAIRMLDDAVRMQSSDGAAKADLASSLAGLADAHFYFGHYAIAESLNLRALALHRQIYGDRYPSVAGDDIRLGHVDTQLGRYPEAERYYRQALAIDQSWYGKDHPETADAATYVAQAVTWEGRYAEAEGLLEPALAAMQRAYGEMHPRVALVVGQLGFVAGQLEKLDDAEAD